MGCIKMFGLTNKEKINSLILNASQNCIETYTSGIKDLLDKQDHLSDQEMEQCAMHIRREYLDAVTNSVLTFFQNSSPVIYSRLQMAMISPRICGMDDDLVNLDIGLSAGALYALCYYAVTNKKAKTYDCSKLSQLQNDLMNQALAKLSENM